MLRVLLIVLLLLGLLWLAVATIGLAFKIVGALFWIALAAGAYLLWSRSRRTS